MHGERLDPLGVGVLDPGPYVDGQETAVTSFAATVKGNSSSRPGTSTTPLVAVDEATKRVSAESSMLW